MGERRGAYRALVEKCERRIPLGRPRHRWEDDIKMDIQEMGWGIDWIDLAEDKDRVVVNTVMNLRVPQNAGNFLSSLGRVSLSGRTLLHGVHLISYLFYVPPGLTLKNYLLATQCIYVFCLDV
jgi:hypothetical protein